MKFIKLTLINDDIIFIFQDNIETIKIWGQDTIITMISHDSYHVKESPEQILEMIAEISAEERHKNLRDYKYTRVIPPLYSNKGMEEFVGKPVIDRRDGKDEVIGKVIRVDEDGKVFYEMDKNI